MSGVTQQPLKVALVVEHCAPERGGLELWASRLAKWLVGRNHKVTLVGTGNGPGPGPIQFMPYETSRKPLTRAARIRETLAHLDVDIVHDLGFGDTADVFQPQTGSRLASAAGEASALPALQRIRTLLSPRTRLWRSEMAILEDRQFADAGRLIAVSALVRSQLAARCGLDPLDITVIHNGVDTQAFSPDSLEHIRQGARQSWNIADAVVFVLVANNYRLKGVDTAIKAMAHLGKHMADMRLLVVGAGDPTPYRKLAGQFGIAERTIFAGRVARMEEAYAAADVALQPTRHDACSLVTLEGLACGLPTITTRANGAGELITNGREGLVMEDASDARALSQAMRRLMDPRQRKLMSAAARTLALNHREDASFTRIEAFYRRRLLVRLGCSQAASSVAGASFPMSSL